MSGTNNRSTAQPASNERKKVQVSVGALGDTMNKAGASSSAAASNLNAPSLQRNKPTLQKSTPVTGTGSHAPYSSSQANNGANYAAANSSLNSASNSYKAPASKHAGGSYAAGNTSMNSNTNSYKAPASNHGAKTNLNLNRPMGMNKTEELKADSSRALAPIASKFSDALKVIKGRNHPNLNELFHEYDPYEGRVYKDWEVQEIFEFKVSMLDIDKLCKANNETAAIRAHRVEYVYLFSTITVAVNTPSSFRNNQRQAQPESIYASIAHKLQGCEHFVTDLLQLPEFIDGKPVLAFQKLFGAPEKPTAKIEINAEKMRTMVCKHLKNGVYDDPCLRAFIEFVAFTPHSYDFSRIKFVAAVRYLLTRFQPTIAAKFDNKMPGQTNVAPTYAPAIAMPVHYDGMGGMHPGQQLQPGQVPGGMGGMHPGQQLQPGHVPGQMMPGNQIAQPGFQAPNMAPNYNQVQMGGDAPFYNHQQTGIPPPISGVGGHGQQLPVHLQELVNRVCNTLNQQRKQVGEAVRGLTPENFQGITTYRIADFITTCEREFHMKNAESDQLAQFFCVAGNPQLLDYNRFSTLISTEQRKYDSLLNKYDVELRLIQDQLKMRHTGTYKWFQNSMRMYAQENCLTLDEFSHAIRGFNITQVTMGVEQEMFSTLDKERRGKVAITEIEGLFKEHMRRAHPHIQPRKVIESIIRAFNGDISFIERELQAIARVNYVLSIDEAMRFFIKHVGYQSFYQDDELVVMIDFFVKSSGRVELSEFIETMNNVLQTQPNLRPNLSTKGIHQTGQAGGMPSSGQESWTPLQSFSTFSEDGTETFKNAKFAQRPAILPRIDDIKVVDLQKACFIHGLTVLDYFQQSRNAGPSGTLSKHDFIQAIGSLGLRWPTAQTEDVFDEVARSQQNGRFNELEANTLDVVVHFLCIKTLKQLHEAILSEITARTTTSGMKPLAQSFEENVRAPGYGQQSFDKKCTVQQLSEVLRNYNYFPEELDMKFLATQYIVSGRSNEIHYQKLIDDINNAQRNVAGSVQSSGDPKSICNAFRKQLHIYSKNEHEYLSEHAERNQRRGCYSQAEFVQLIGQRLQLSPEVCNDQQLMALWGQIDVSQSGSMQMHQIIQYVDNNSKPIEDLKTDIMKQLVENRDFDTRFTQNPVYLQSGQMFPIGQFEEVMKQLFVKRIDYTFLIQFYQDFSKQFVNAINFVQDTLRCKPTQIGPGGQPPYNNRINQPIVDERQARQALSVIAQQAGEQQKIFTTKLQRLLRGSDSGFIDMLQFGRILNETIPQVTQNEQNLLQDKYQRDRDPGLFNYQQFYSDLTQLVKHTSGSGGTIISLNDQEKRLYLNLKNSLEAGSANVKFVINIKAMDSLEQGYLNDAMIIQAFHNTYKDMKSQTRVQRMSDNQIRDLLRPLNKNQAGFNSYREILIHTFGEELGQKYFLMDRQQLESEASGGVARDSARFQRPQQIKGAKSNALGAIGTKMIVSNINYEDVMKNVMGSQNVDNRIIVDQIWQFIQQINVNLTTDERNQVIEWHRQVQDAQGMVSALAFLQDVGLPPQTLQAQAQKKRQTKELTQQELLEAQALMNQISRDLQQNGKRPSDVIEKHRRNHSDAGMQPKDFARVLKQEVPNLKDSLTNAKLSTLVHYLVKEQFGIVSFEKLHRALNLTERDPPLRQDKLEEIKATKVAFEKELKSLDVPISVIHLIHFLQQNQLSINEMFKVPGEKPIGQDAIINERVFDDCCAERSYEPKDRTRLISSLMQTGGKGRGISLYHLQMLKRKYEQKNTKGSSSANAASKYGRFDQALKEKIDRVSKWMQANNFTNVAMYEQLDRNKDGSIDKKEFLDGIGALQIPGIMQRDLLMIFEAIDTDNNQYLSINEFSLYLEGATKKREERIRDLPAEIVNEIDTEIRQLFSIFDEDGNGLIDKYELIKTFQGLGYEMDEAKAEAMISAVDKDGDMKLNLEEFSGVMRPEMQTRLLEQDDRIEDFRAMFKDADTDYSGYLSIDEFYTCLLKNGIDLSYEELLELIAEFDVDGGAQLDIDEFVALMNTSSDLAFNSSNAKSTYLKIRMNRRLQVTDFMKALKSLPSAFVPSVFHQKWVKENRNRPSDVLKAQLDPQTMTWKDMLTVTQDHLTPEMTQNRAMRPMIRPIENQYGCEITIEAAQGIPLPPTTKDFDRQMVVKRALRIGIFNATKKEYIANAVQVEARWEESAEDKWLFNKSNISLNPLLFRSTKKDDLDLANTQFVFEFVIYYKKANQNNELCCGWALTDDLTLVSRNAKTNLKVHGGSPTTEILIQESDVHTKRTGLQGLLKAFSSKITSQLTVSFKPHTALEPEIKQHMQFLPSTCLIQKKILLFVSAYRNYAGKQLLKESTLGNFKQPGGSVTLSTFPKLIDNIDILEVLTAVWNEDVLATMTAAQKKNFDTIILKMNEVVHKIYPVLFADEFDMSQANYMSSACYEPVRMQLRNDMLNSALRFGKPAKGGQPAPKLPIEDMTTFKPFNVRETQWEVWDVKESKYEQYLNLHQARGMFDQGQQQQASRPAQVSFSNAAPTGAMSLAPRGGMAAAAAAMHNPTQNIQLGGR